MSTHNIGFYEEISKIIWNNKQNHPFNNYHKIYYQIHTLIISSTVIAWSKADSSRLTAIWHSHYSSVCSAGSDFVSPM